MQILKNVDILDLTRTHIYMGHTSKEDPLPYKVFIEALDPTKKVVFDESALQILNNKVTERVQQFDNGRDPRVVNYIKEFVGRMLTELYRNGLVELEDIPEGSDDPYMEVKKQFKSLT